MGSDILAIGFGVGFAVKLGHMPRVPRKYLLVPGLSLHKTWRGHNKEYNLQTPVEKKTYIRYLNEEITKQSSALNALCLMSNHSHEVYTLGPKPDSTRQLGDFFRRHHSRYGIYFNKKHDRCGKVAQDRPFTCSVEPEDATEMELTFYIHANPIRAGICNDAKDFVFSTHKLYAFGKKEPWMKHIVFPTWYIRLGKTMKDRQRVYRRLFDAYLRKKGLIKVAHSIYGWGSLLWLYKRKLHIRDQIKAHNTS